MSVRALATGSNTPKKAGSITTEGDNNHSHSGKGVLRGLHYQIEQAQGKLVRAVTGEVYDAVVDLRRSSPSFGRCEGFVLSAHRLAAPAIQKTLCTM